jgi:chaperone modulatory protein CbpM
MAAHEDDAMWLYAYGEVTLVQLAQASGLEEALLRELVEYGALAPADAAAAEWCFSGACVARLRAAARLRSDLELDTPAVALVLRFLERIDDLEARVRELGAQLARPRR